MPPAMTMMYHTELEESSAQAKLDDYQEPNVYETSSSYIEDCDYDRPEVTPDHPALLGSLTPPSNCSAHKILNFSPGPTSLAPAVEEAVKTRCFPENPSDLWLGTMALSHRSPEFGAILRRTVELTREVMKIPDEYEILFMQGGGNGQFAAVPMNLCPTGKEKATYVVNGTWSVRAVGEAEKYCQPQVISSQNDDGTYTSFPSYERLVSEIDPESKYLYLCSNETVNGIELHSLPHGLPVPLIVDASSDFSSKPVAWREANVGVLFACASKNIGHPGVTLVVIRNDLLDQANPFCPGVLNYSTNVKAENVWNTIPTFNVDVVGIVMEWLLKEGGMNAIERLAIEKSDLLYDAIDDSDGFFTTPVHAASGVRSRMNVPFNICGGDEYMTDLFLVECWKRGIVGLRTITPFSKSQYLRASLYHGVSLGDVETLVAFMKDFVRTHDGMHRHYSRRNNDVLTPPLSPKQNKLSDLCPSPVSSAMNLFEVERDAKVPSGWAKRVVTWWTAP